MDMADTVGSELEGGEGVDSAERIRRALARSLERRNARSGRGKPLTKAEFWRRMSAEDRAVLTELQDAFGPCEFVEAWEV